MKNLSILNDEQIKNLGYTNLKEIENECYGMINAIFDNRQSKKNKIDDISEIINIMMTLFKNVSK